MSAVLPARLAVALTFVLALALAPAAGAQPASGPSGGIDPSALGSDGGGEAKAVVPGKSGPDSADGGGSAAEATITTDPNLGLSDPTGAPAACDGTQGPPPRLIPIYIQAAKKYGLGERGPQILAAINRLETDFGRLNEVTSSAGAIGWMQFMPPTWDAYGVDGDGDGDADPYNARDAIHSAANYLSASGAPGDWYDAIWAYNHADWYVEDVLEYATCYGALQDTVKPDRMTVFSCQARPNLAGSVPTYYLRAFENSAARYDLGQDAIWAMAAVARIESDFGRGMTPETTGETGPMGLEPDQWKRYGVDGDGDGLVTRDSPWDGVATFARLIWSEGSVEEALFAHNHAAWYVEAVTRDANRLAGKCEKSKSAWTILYPRPTTNATEINWDNLQILNPVALADIESGRLDPRVTNLLAYLTARYRILVSSLRSDHSMLTTSGNVSNHYYGRALDIAAVNGIPCTDMSYDSPCSQVGRLLVALPAGARPTELIYGYDLDGPGPAFAMADHRDHIHAGFGA